MDLVHERAAGLDISKSDAKVAIRVPGKRAGTFHTEVTTWGSTTNQILALRDMLVAAKVTTVVMEATSDYWKPFYYLFEDVLPVMLVNAKAARNIPGRKTDVSDASWLAQLGAHGLLRPCFVPPPPIRVLRDLTRARTIATNDRTREVHRLEKFLESTGIKLSDYVSELMGGVLPGHARGPHQGRAGPSGVGEPGQGATAPTDPPTRRGPHRKDSRNTTHLSAPCTLNASTRSPGGSRNSPRGSRWQWNPFR
ncbi:hypothetical protein GCM10025778_15900 [Paeniglutamicibacter antarcticus]|uniref:Transposase IS110-like N-terminal domain-containing protein n=1 Tax=Paeniglutamicibacter antarcticus TaxID=494023 RepID=A0ABP9TKG9_9MICC